MNVIGCGVVKVIMGYLSCNTMWPEDFGCSTVVRGPGIFKGLLFLLFTEQDNFCLVFGSS